MGKKKNKGGVSETLKDSEAQDGDDDASSAAAADPVDIGDEPAPAKLPPGSISAAADPETPTLRDTTVVKGRAETRHVKSVPYCEVCSLPFEFCEWNTLGSSTKCQESFQANWQTHFPDVEGEEALTALITQLGLDGGDDASKRAQKGAKKGAAAADGGDAQPQSKKDKKKQEPAEIIIELNNRNKKKHITTVRGLEKFEVDTTAAAKLFGKRFACGSALKKGQNGQPDQIEIQGSYRDELPAVLVDKLKMSMDDIVVMIDGKKVKASAVGGGC